MKFLHTSDLHIGKIVNGFSMLEDQKAVLDQIAELAIVRQVDAVFLSGDLYDRAVAPAVAVEVFDRFLTKLYQARITVFAVAGNHDCGQRISFAGEILRAQGFHMEGNPRGQVAYRDLQDDYGTVRIHLLPFARPAQVRYLYETEVCNFQQSVKQQLSHVTLLTGGRNVLLTHHFVIAGSSETLTCDSDSRILVGGADQVDASLFEPFDYVALGHLHSPQQIGERHIYYPGSPMKYSFSEVHHKKSVIYGELNQDGSCRIQRLEIKPVHDMRRIKGKLTDLIRQDVVAEADPKDYIMAILTNEEELLDPIGTLRAVYPNMMLLQFEKPTVRQQDLTVSSTNFKEMCPEQMFQCFFREVTGKELTRQQEAVIKEVIDQAVEVEA